jgi:hypothetical protein
MGTAFLAERDPVIGEQVTVNPLVNALDKFLTNSR